MKWIARQVRLPDGSWETVSSVRVFDDGTIEAEGARSFVHNLPDKLLPMFSERLQRVVSLEEGETYLDALLAHDQSCRARWVEIQSAPQISNAIVGCWEFQAFASGEDGNPEKPIHARSVLRRQAAQRRCLRHRQTRRLGGRARFNLTAFADSWRGADARFTAEWNSTAECGTTAPPSAP